MLKLLKCTKCQSPLPPNRILCSCGHYNWDASEDGGETGPYKDESILLEDIVSSDVDRIQTGHWDDCFGTVENEQGEVINRGMVRGSTILIAGAPGAGKSTLFLGMAASVIQLFNEGEVLYLASEEQLPQIRARWDRLKLVSKRRLRFLDLRKGVTDITPILKNHKFILLLLDSLAAIADEAEVQIQICKVVKEYATYQHSPAVISHHVNKGEEIAGLMKLQHEVDTTATFFPIPEVIVDGEAVRELETRKNRNGRAWVRRYFNMTNRGLMPAEDPFPEGKGDEYIAEQERLAAEYEDDEPESEPNPRIRKKPKKAKKKNGKRKEASDESAGRDANGPEPGRGTRKRARKSKSNDGGDAANG